MHGDPSGGGGGIREKRPLLPRFGCDRSKAKRGNLHNSTLKATTAEGTKKKKPKKKKKGPWRASLRRGTARLDAVIVLGEIYCVPVLGKARDARRNSIYTERARMVWIRDLGGPLYLGTGQSPREEHLLLTDQLTTFVLKNDGGCEKSGKGTSTRRIRGVKGQKGSRRVSHPLKGGSFWSRRDGAEVEMC